MDAPFEPPIPWYVWVCNKPDSVTGACDWRSTSVLSLLLIETERLILATNPSVPWCGNKSITCVCVVDACLSGNDCSSQLSGFHNVLLCGVADFVLKLVVYLMLFSVTIVYSIIVMMKNVAILTFIHNDFIVIFMVHWNYKRLCCLFDSSVLSSPRSINHIYCPIWNSVSSFVPTCHSYMVKGLLWWQMYCCVRDRLLFSYLWFSLMTLYAIFFFCLSEIQAWL